ncbi:hypothetical protein [Sinanaerobacter sp. ZZT-01]|uniref:hypothetical protein n=1 Tax=Sinanaerobacter sp. ZZT-01 TaxID=3111540 RepID=UPI002D79CACC|nr:hypothetical protein [Sinanaerobacter sp. ZZT-01]WRR93358.1 hypothetical protein U5921_15210 [Sinanaerobacter sp. ZZT-01]
MVKLEEVFGVSRKPVLSYIERQEVDVLFENALKSDKQIIVYGASKQGKTALVSRYLIYDDCLAVSCSPKSKVKDIYNSILRKLDIEIMTNEQKSTSANIEAGAVAKIKSKIPFIVSGEVEGSTKVAGSTEQQLTYKTIEFNLELPQDIFDLYVQAKSDKFVILEDFHYLPIDVQKQLAFDLRTFQELGLRFIILGVWKEKNRLIQFNGDLQDRIAEIPVEPWDETEFISVAKKGAQELNVEFSDEIIKRLCAESLGSIGVLQELLKLLCVQNGIVQSQRTKKLISNLQTLNCAIKSKCDDYSSRHVRALEDIAKGQRDFKITDGKKPLFLPYYFVVAILGMDFDSIIMGVQRKKIDEAIKDRHYRAADIRPSDIGFLLSNLANLQASKKIQPPLFDYDVSQRSVNIIDSTFYFFFKNCDKNEVIENIENPLD